MANIEIKEPENLLVYDKSYSVDFVRETIEKRGLNGLRIFDHLDRLPDLDFLKDYTFLTQLSVASLGDHDYSFLKQLTNLRSLTIGVVRAEKHEIDLSNQSDLEKLVINWPKRIKGLENCQRLEELMLIEYKEKDLSPIKALGALKTLSIKTASIRGLDGIEGCKELEAVLLGNCSRLTSIRALSHLPKLRRIVLNKTAKVQDYTELSDLPMLDELKIIDCKKIPSIDFIQRFPALKRIVLTGDTEVANGDMNPLLALESVFYNNHRGYNIRYPPPNLRKS